MGGISSCREQCLGACERARHHLLLLCRHCGNSTYTYTDGGSRGLSFSILSSPMSFSALLRSTVAGLMGRGESAAPTEAYEVNTAKLPVRLWDVFSRTFDLGVTAFGGPPVHFQIFHRRFVEGAGGTPWIDEQTVRILVPGVETQFTYFLLVSRDICGMPGSSRSRFNQNALQHCSNPRRSYPSPPRLHAVVFARSDRHVRSGSGRPTCR